MEFLVTPFSMAFAKALGVIAFLPLDFLGLSNGLRLILAVLLAIAGITHVNTIQDITFISYLIEFLLGFIVALPVVILVQAADLWGDLFESLRGQTSGTLADPLFQGETSYLALLCKGYLWAALLGQGVLENLIVKYFDSFKLSALDIILWQKCFVLLCEVFTASMALLLPFAFLFLAIEVTAMFAARLLPGLSMFCEIFTAKLTLGILGLFLMLDLEILGVTKALISKIQLF